MKPNHVVVSGGSGLIGSALISSLRGDGVDVTQLVRGAGEGGDEGVLLGRLKRVHWDPTTGVVDPGVLDGADAVVNLNGASIGKLPWTRNYRKTLHDSRLGPTKTLARAIKALGAGAPAFISASAVGIYGSQPGQELTEAAPAGTTYLAGLCQRWEQAALSAGEQAPVAVIRTASVLHAQAVLKPLMLLTKFGLGGPLGSSRQVWPWISLDDEVRAIRHVIEEGLTGPVNLCGPTAATARDIGAQLARQMHRPYLIPAPALALRAILSADAADSLLLADANTVPSKLAESGFDFTHRNIVAAIAHALAD